MKYFRCFFPFVLIILISLTVCKEESTADSIPDYSITPLVFDIPDIQVSRSEIVSYITGNIYYIDANTGDDTTGNGSSGAPWKTIGKAQSMAVSGDGVILKAGTYDGYEETAPSGRTDYVVYMNAEEESVTIKHIHLRYNFTEKTDAYLIFYGITLAPDWVDPASSGNPGSDDPQYPDSDFSTYAKSSDPVYIYRGKHFQIHNSVLQGTNKYLTEHGVWMDGAEDIIVQYNEIHTVGSIVQFQGVSDVKIFYNHGYTHRSSCFREGYASAGLVHIEGNHCEDSNYDQADDWCTKGVDKNYHGSAIAIRSGEKVIRNNIFHNGWNSSGIMLYSDGSSIYNNILVENNLLYDIHNNYVFRLYNAGLNIVFRNNIFAACYRVTTNPVYRYETAIAAHSYADGYSGPGLTLYNNIFIGHAFLLSDHEDTENYNIFYTLNGDCDPDIGNNSKYVTCTGSANTAYFEDGSFFNESVSTGNLDFNPLHGKTLDFGFAPGSEGINFGNPGNQPADSLGSLDVNGFIQKDGTPRDGDHHSAGPYEY